MMGLGKQQICMTSKYPEYYEHLGFVTPCVYIYIIPIGSMYGIYANIWGILMVNVIHIHGSYGKYIYIYVA